MYWQSAPPNVCAHSLSWEVSTVPELAVICLKWNARNFWLAEEIRTTKAWINNAILLWTAHQSEQARPRATQARTTAHGTIFFRGQPATVYGKQLSRWMICKCSVMQGFLQGHGMDRSTTKVNNCAVRGGGETNFLQGQTDGARLVWLLSSNRSAELRSVCVLDQVEVKHQRHCLRCTASTRLEPSVACVLPCFLCICIWPKTDLC